MFGSELLLLPVHFKVAVASGITDSHTHIEVSSDVNNLMNLELCRGVLTAEIDGSECRT